MQPDRPDDTIIGEFATLIDAVRAAEPEQAAALLAHEPATRIEAVLRTLPTDAAVRVAAALPGATLGTPNPTISGRVRDLMEPAVGVLRDDTTAAGALDHLVHAVDVSPITYLYVVDGADRLSGVVVMRNLLLARPGAGLSDLMIREPYAMRPDMPIGEAVRVATRRHYPVYPVVDDERRVIGLVRGWRLFERQAAELTGQSGRMVGVNVGERAATPMWTAFRLRHPWMQLNLLTAFLAAFVVGMFQDTIAQIVALAAFLPVLAGQSGNNGCQTLAITLRSLTLGDIEDFSLRKLLIKEIGLGFWNGLLTGFVAGIAMFVAATADGSPNALMLGIVIQFAMVGACMASGLFGVMVPLALRRFGTDPATASSIFLTTATDIVGMGLMLALATVLVL